MDKQLGSLFYVHNRWNQTALVLEIPVIKIGKLYIYASNNPNDPRPIKIEKATMRKVCNYSSTQFYRTKVEAEDAMYVANASWRLADEVRDCHDAAKLRAIAAIIQKQNA